MPLPTDSPPNPVLLVTVPPDPVRAPTLILYPARSAVPLLTVRALVEAPKAAALPAVRVPAETAVVPE